jgi:membrane protein
MAAVLASYTIFSITPLLIIVISIAGLVFGEDAARGEIIGQAQGLVGRAGAEVIQSALKNAHQPGLKGGTIASLLSLAILIFGASGVFVQLQDALNAIWNVAPEQGSRVYTHICAPLRFTPNSQVN